MKEELHAVSARIPESDFKEVERIANKRNLSQAHVIRMLVGVGIECHKDMEALGLIGVIDIVYYVKEAMKLGAKGRQMKLPI
jgi:hypothetical protein